TEHRHRHEHSIASDSRMLAVLRRNSHIVRNVVELKDSTFTNHSGGEAVSGKRVPQSDWHHLSIAPHLAAAYTSEAIAVGLPHGASERLTQSDRTACNRIEDRLRLRLRIADRSENLARSRLLIESFGQIPVPRLQFLEQADVLNCDDGLVSEGLQQGDL